ncbi:Phage antirepressor protein [Latilactobacillus sakei]|uniref:phage antirepressor n=1 Tax=Latilactobacillus sakei TaxID=1599 RepID=UPI000C6F31A3|nr:phage antirepressor KilAC domain-containing protein [Latilactobacillus sakei]SON67231.1 Phage antirepressor protein [Latilactobacillus sakei]
MKDLQLFNFNGDQVRTVLIGGEPYFVGKDVADILGYSETNAMTKRLDEEDFISTKLSGMNMKSTIINESGLYAAIIGSKLPKAKKFKRWVTGEVLPSIRKNGAYLTDQKAFDVTHNPNALGDLLLQAGEQLKRKDLQITEMKPKALFADAVAVSHSSILIGELAKIMKQNGVNIGQNRLFEWMRVNGYLISGNRSDKNMPTQKSLELGLFKIKETVINHSDGHTTINKTPKVTGKGQQYFINKFLKTA